MGSVTVCRRVTNQLELFGDCSTNGNAGQNHLTGATVGENDASTSSYPASDSRVDRDPRQDRGHDNPKVGQGPVQTTGLAQALGNTPAPFDFSAAIRDDPRAVPRPDVPVPTWLRLPGVDP
jgi:hypothetical protein